FGIAFAATLVVVALLQLTGRENPDHISEGSGINRSSEELHRAAVARARERMRREREQAQAQGTDGTGSTASDDPNPSDDPTRYHARSGAEQACTSRPTPASVVEQPK